VEGQEGRRVLVSGIEVEFVVEILGLSWLKLVVVARSTVNKAWARSQQSGTRK
jgi:hypothetical protein